MGWIDDLLARNARTAYLRHYGSPLDIRELPVVTYDDLQPWLERVYDGEPDVLFAGRPVAYERTSGSSGGSKLIPYSVEGLHDIQRAIAPWISRVFSEITGSVYLAISPATRAPESIGGIPVGLPDTAYVGAFKSAVPPTSITDVSQWLAFTIEHLRAARDLQLISVWSPTFLLRLLDEAEFDWPELKIISCWAHGTSKPYAEELGRRFPHARIEPKGLISTECIVTVPGVGLNPYGFFEFEPVGDAFEVIATTASGLYRYRTGDLVHFVILSSEDGEGPVALDGARSDTGPSPSARLRMTPSIEFIGRAGTCDLVGEKLTEPFVARCLEHIPGIRFLKPNCNGYLLYAEASVDLEIVERKLCENPQYAYARNLGQLAPLRFMPLDRNAYIHDQLARGARLGDIKPLALVRS